MSKPRFILQAMVHFGKRLSALQYGPWHDQYLDYVGLKQILEEQQDDNAHREREFVRQLNREIEKSVLFFLREQGELASRLSLLRKEERLLALEVRHEATRAKEEASLMLRHKLQDLLRQYQNVGEDLVHLVHYVELSVTGVRKILKKHDKLYRGNKLSNRYLSKYYWHAEDSHLGQLLHYEGVGALVTTLEDSFTQIRALDRILQHSDMNESRHRRTRTEPNLTFTSPPSSPSSSLSKTLGHSQTPGPFLSSGKTIKRLRRVQDQEQLQMQEPILLKIDAARHRLDESSRFASLLAAGMMIERVQSDEDWEAMMITVEEVELRPKAPPMSNFLNLMSAFLYLTSYYIVAPTSGHYASILAGNEAFAGLIIGMTPIAALASTVLYSWWTSHSYKAALIFASSCSIVGNLLYALGLPYQSLTLVILGRLLNGFGSARAINRRYIADSFSRQERTAASAAFVTAGALGMAAGPAIAAILDLTPNIDVWWTTENAPGWVMAVFWIIYLLALIIWFRDPPKSYQYDSPPKPPSHVEMNKGRGEKKPLLSSKMSSKDELAKPTPPPPLWMNIPVMTTLAIYFVIKLGVECVLCSTGTLTRFFFDWGATDSGIYLAVLGLLMFPANLFVAYCSRYYDDRELIMGMLVMMLVGACGIIQYGPKESYTLFQYVTFGVCIFMATTALEGPNMSLLSKTIPSSWAKGLFNVGFLATEAGTFGRAVGDAYITLSALGGIEHLLNRMFVSLAIVVAITTAGTYQVYPYLEPYDKDD